MPDEKQIDRIMGMFTDMWKERNNSNLGTILQNIVAYSKRYEDLEDVSDDEIEAFLCLYRQRGYTGLSLAVREAERERESAEKERNEKLAKVDEHIFQTLQGTINVEPGIRFAEYDDGEDMANTNNRDMAWEAANRAMASEAAALGEMEME